MDVESLHDRALRLAEDLVGAAARCELELHLQPEVGLGAGELTGAEALLRWYHPAEGLFWPADVLPLAEARGLGTDLTAWVIGTAAAAALRWAESSEPRTCWVNLTERGLARGAAAAMAVNTRLELPHNRLGLHVPVTPLAFDPAGSATWVADSRAAGVPVVADGVGTISDPSVERTGRALVAHTQALVGLPLNGIVLGRAVVQHAEALSPAIEAAVRQAASCGWDVAAVGVENWETAVLLSQLGVTRATGHVFGAAVRPDRLRWMMGCEGSSWRGSFMGDRGAAQRLATAPLAPGALAPARRIGSLRDGVSVTQAPAGALPTPRAPRVEIEVAPTLVG